MNHLRLQLHVSFALVDDRAIFLDVRRDRYFALDEAAAEAFADLRADADCQCSDERTETLLATGLFARSPEPLRIRSATIGAPERDLPDDGARPALRDLIQILFLAVRYHRGVRQQPLETVIAKRRRTPAKTSKGPHAATLALAQRFLRARALVPIKPVCLQDSLALHDWLAAHDAPSSLVLGVRLDPFAAHCWVQHGDIVLNDAADRVAPYTPILVVE
ncbi:MAG: lasso peptide biosynthesis B2 protein [Pseudomonadota bacterium]